MFVIYFTVDLVNVNFFVIKYVNYFAKLRIKTQKNDHLIKIKILCHSRSESGALFSIFNMLINHM